MSDELDLFITQLTTVLGAMTGIKQAPEHPPEALNEFPAVICYFVKGEFSYGAGAAAVGVHMVHADVHLGRSVLPSDEEYARPYILRALTAIAGHLQMNSTCEHCVLNEYQYGRLGYAGAETFGVRLVLEVKFLHSGITVAA
jgi:hypothetical protein